MDFPLAYFARSEAYEALGRKDYAAIDLEACARLLLDRTPRFSRRELEWIPDIRKKLVAYGLATRYPL